MKIRLTNKPKRVAISDLNIGDLFKLDWAYSDFIFMKTVGVKEVKTIGVKEGQVGSVGKKNNCIIIGSADYKEEGMIGEFKEFEVSLIVIPVKLVEPLKLTTLASNQ